MCVFHKLFEGLAFFTLVKNVVWRICILRHDELIGFVLSELGHVRGYRVDRLL
jgi:hypothetical protein